ncbi:unannotated protein [freshwater metagenome]|uniref:Unannotated protein n=1 Tax=freshwater metagenome TaxID=449393 RepID=A0A6J6Y8B1_9ZZZZ
MTGHSHHGDATLGANNGECFGDAAFAADTVDDVISAASEANNVAIANSE